MIVVATGVGAASTSGYSAEAKILAKMKQIILFSP
jgi:hypothetical protein